MKTLAFAHLNGNLDALEQLRETTAAERPDLVVFAGNATGPGERQAERDARTFDALFRTLADLPGPVVIVPGEHDAPERAFLAASVSRLWVERQLHAIHGAFAVVRNFAVAGFGGAITERERETERALRYPSWEVLYRMAFLRELEQSLLLVFHHPPAEMKAIDLVDAQHIGQPAVTELIGTWRPKVAVVAGVEPGREEYGDTIVISCGRFDQGDYAVFDARSGRTVEFKKVSGQPVAR
jgi:Icc-related predicted phosphoesterase